LSRDIDAVKAADLFSWNAKRVRGTRKWQRATVSPSSMTQLRERLVYGQRMQFALPVNANIAGRSCHTLTPTGFGADGELQNMLLDRTTSDGCHQGGRHDAVLQFAVCFAACVSPQNKHDG